MIYLLEGPDGTGKTTIARNLVNASMNAKRSCMFIHCTNTSQDKSVTVDEGYERLLKDLNYWRSLDYDVVIDRAWVSNIVYTEVYEPGKAHISDEVAEKLFKAVDKAIICLPKNKGKYMMHFNNLANSRDEAYLDNMDKIYDKFNEFAEKYCRYDMFDHFTNKPEQIKIEDIDD